MTNHLLDITVKCRGNDQCIFEEQDVFLDISVTNTQETEIGFPLDYLQKTGPIIRLIDSHTEADTYVKTNLADFDLREKFTAIQPGESLAIEWVLTSDELKQFGGPYVDVSAEITVMAEIQLEGEKVEFRGTYTLRIVTEGKE